MTETKVNYNALRARGHIPVRYIADGHVSRLKWLLAGRLAEKGEVEILEAAVYDDLQRRFMAGESTIRVDVPGLSLGELRARRNPEAEANRAGTIARQERTRIARA